MCMSRVIPQVWEKKGIIQRGPDGAYVGKDGTKSLFSGFANKWEQMRRKDPAASATVQRMAPSGAQRSLLG